MTTAITRHKPATSANALNHFEAIMAFEADCWDMNDTLVNGKPDFVLLDVRSPDMYSSGHIEGAINLPHGKIIKSKMARWETDTVFVVYCAGPHCNGATKAAINLARLGRPVKSMPGGVTGWIDEGFSLVKGDCSFFKTRKSGMINNV